MTIYEVKDGQVYEHNGDFYTDALEAYKMALSQAHAPRSPRLTQGEIEFPSAPPTRRGGRRILLKQKIRVQTVDGEWRHSFPHFSAALDWAAAREDARRRLNALVKASSLGGANMVKAVECYGCDGKTYTAEVEK